MGVSPQLHDRDLTDLVLQRFGPGLPVRSENHFVVPMDCFHWLADVNCDACFSQVTAHQTAQYLEVDDCFRYLHAHLSSVQLPRVIYDLVSELYPIAEG